MIGQSIAHYKIIEKLGEGGMGVVYKAEDTKLHRYVALKFLPANLTSDKKTKDRFLNEAQSASKLDHPNICTIHEIGEAPDHGLFIVMPFYEGETLKEKISRGQLPLNEAIDITLQIAKGLAKAHEQNITHRDIKPGNIIITEEGVVKIVDFGIAKLAGKTKVTMTGATLGTVTYMSPEQAKGAEIDNRSDIWSLGVTFYEMLTGRPPFASEYDQAIIYGILNEEPEPPSALNKELPVEIDYILAKTLEKNPSKRYQNAEEFIEDIENLKKDISAGISKRKIFRWRKHRRKKVYVYSAIVVLLILIVIAVRTFIWTGAEKPIDSIAVLPLNNLTNDPDQEYFVEGIQDALTTQLSKISALKIISRTSTMHYKNTNKTAPQIAKELGVNGLIEGSVQRSGDRVRIIAQLINGPADRHIWAQEFVRPVTDIFTLQSEIAQTIAKEIKINITAQEKSSIVTTHTINPVAQEAFFKASFLMRKLTSEGITKAYDYLQEAIKADSNWAPPYAWLADWYIQSVYNGATPDEVYPKAKMLSEKALKLDPTLAQAYFELAEISAFNRDWMVIDKNCLSGLGLNPNSAIGHEMYATLLSTLCRHEDALREIRHAVELDPISNNTRGQYAMILTRARMFEEAIKQAREAISLDPEFEVGYLRLAWALRGAGKFDEAVATMKKALSLFSKSQYPWKTFAAELFSHTGRKDSAKQLISEVIQNTDQKYLFYAHIASTYFALGDKDEALRWLEQAYKIKDPDLLYEMTNPQLDGVRNDPRIQELLRKMNAPESVYNFSKKKD
jgi:eukaryotic-like serine/threonine-protein kinase